MGMGKINITSAKEMLKKKKGSSSATDCVKKGHFAVYVGKMNKRYVIPLSTLNHPLFKDLLRWVEEEYGFDNSEGCLKIPCSEDYFDGLVSLITST
ncbi:auxin-induced protein 15A-like [Rutidosis leptorrhynchoides]|uniref:auxin-induced protein 15A-like n=1 Tax=Rutidosis leptorrhynchoides TaxID=125765 RepID=UPI003A9A3201